MKYLSVIFLTILVCHSASGDDGSWSKEFTTKSGSIYSTEENPDIALEKELLVFTGSETFVYFLFKNLTDKDLVVDAGFPIKHNINSFMKEGVRAISNNPYGPSDMPLVDYFITQKDEFAYEYEDEPYYQLEDEVLIIPENNRREFINISSVDSELNFIIIQDDDEVPIEQVLLEKVADLEELSLTFHFKHQLKFKAGQASLVRVRYNYDLHFGSGGAVPEEYYRWDYVIGTGGTWSGAIEDFYMIVPGEWSGRENVKDLNVVFQTDYLTVYGKKQYEPAMDDAFVFTTTRERFYELYEHQEKLMENNFNSPRQVPAPNQPAQKIVGSISSSSELKDRISVFTEQGTIKQAGFTSLSAVDGYAETSWSEAASGDGRGEYLEIEFTDDVWGLVFQSGFTRITYPDYVYNNGRFEKDFRDDGRGVKDYFNYNNRPYSLLIQDMKGNNIYELFVEDIRAPQVYPGVLLPMGRYRFVIDGVYKGSKWDDTCISELYFFPVSELVNGDTLLTDPFFAGSLPVLWYHGGQ